MMKKAYHMFVFVLPHTTGKLTNSRCSEHASGLVRVWMKIVKMVIHTLNSSWPREKSVLHGDALRLREEGQSIPWNSTPTFCSTSPRYAVHICRRIQAIISISRSNCIFKFNFWHFGRYARKQKMSESINKTKWIEMDCTVGDGLG